MNRLPPQPLDAEERALAAQLPRLHGRSEPTADLDARILAAAHAAAQQPAKPARRRWAAPLALAASLCLAVGVAWRVQVTPPPPATAPTLHGAEPSAAATENARLGAPATDSAPSTASIAQPKGQLSAAASTPPTATAPPPASPRVLAPPPPEDPPVVMQAPRAFAQEAAASPVLPPAPPAPAVAAARAAPAPAPTAEPAQATANGALAPAAARASDALATPAAPRPEAALRKAMQAQRLPEPASADAPVDDVPPATMASPAARDAWLKRIRQLQQQGDVEAARASLAEFRRRYPQATLPPELRELERGQESTTPDPAAH